jgi:YD repeat-containing protein
VDGPLPKDAITYTYEALGRLLTRAINGAAVTYTYDAVGRVTQEMNALATFTYTYDGTSRQLATMTCPGVQTFSHSCGSAISMQRLPTSHRRPEKYQNRSSSTSPLIESWRGAIGTRAPPAGHCGAPRAAASR